ncbi:hypothetical protein Hdeb2414_s0005g00183651 [Helianthus debilis subsp. tardiflorus]
MSTHAPNPRPTIPHGLMYTCIAGIRRYKGFQIAPADLEDVLATHPAILDATVTSDWKIGKLYK